MFFLCRVSFVLAVLMAMGCSEEPKSTLPTIQVPEKTDSDLVLNKIAKSVKTIQLETKKEALLGHIFRVKQYDDKLFIPDRNKVLVFDLEGKFLYQIGIQGEGPGEYRGVSSFALDPNTGNVYIASDIRILVYTSEGELLMEKKFTNGVFNLGFVNGKLYKFIRSLGNKVNNGFGNYTSLLEFTPELELLDSIPVKSVFLKKLMVSRSPYMHYLYNNGLGTYLYYPVLSPEEIYRDTLYQYKDNKLAPYLKLDFERPQSLDEEGFKVTQILNIIDSSSYLFCEYSQHWKRRFFVFNKRDSTSYNLKVGPLDGQGEPVVLRPLDLEKDIFYYVKTSEFMDKETEESNPIVGIVEMK
ncbi:6-bladed beta-propeller [Echinicola salinicaeni]|uniref:6-bladed beta-propeller n=1 Tax=Echinicola salinicaeni TaxID=2762757 RepID=UPI0016480443|nr:6-bladed beta-propeller [Echinicola salinicaeni]